MCDAFRPSPLRNELTFTLAPCPNCLHDTISLIFHTSKDTFWRCAACDTVWFKPSKVMTGHSAGGAVKDDIYE